MTAGASVFLSGIMRLLRLLLIAAISAGTAGCCREEAGMTRTGISRLVLNYDSRTDPGLQKSLEQADDAQLGLPAQAP